MTTTTHTRGPWVAVANPGREPVTHYVTTGDGLFCIADLPSGSTCTAENAALIAAAPDLLAALRLALDTIASLHGHYCPDCKGGCPDLETIAIGRAAIAKAEGAA